ncbi:carboxypeptidase-like protein [Dokdonia sp. Hel_I_63]|uniref:carboxypeptidase-like regulatory domain-containing protein n=1 Tax=Dokdonia sp. Hel_I_63 TaxID=1249996 RepID=UPI00119B7276|nr:carboxypeptidase-like regulatory domain-containing protein [Dokdonia sp. Hel_I_63]TVZ22564.1 carboxypeptidase-like protein [Dokdonia sp. Hel_I_63]
MKKPIALTIPKPCHEDWTKMTPTQQGKHCAVCNKEVIDFTAHTTTQLRDRIVSGDSICGRFRKDQLGTPLSLSHHKGRSFAQYAASLLVPIATLSAGDAASQTTEEVFITGDIAPVELPINAYDSLGIGSLSRKHKTPQKLVTIKGTVTDMVGPLPGVNITVHGTSRAYQTDFEGNYSLKVYPGETIKYSFLGYEPRTILVGSQVEINVNFKDEDQNILLGEVLILDYKQIKKEERREKRRLKKEKGH